MSPPRARCLASSPFRADLVGRRSFPQVRLPLGPCPCLSTASLFLSVAPACLCADKVAADARDSPALSSLATISQLPPSASPPLRQACQRPPALSIHPLQGLCRRLLADCGHGYPGQHDRQAVRRRWSRWRAQVSGPACLPSLGLLPRSPHRGVSMWRFPTRQPPTLSTPSCLHLHVLLSDPQSFPLFCPFAAPRLAST